MVRPVAVLCRSPTVSQVLMAKGLDIAGDRDGPPPTITSVFEDNADQGPTSTRCARNVVH